jgi:type I restriction enzyme, S subunit
MKQVKTYEQYKDSGIEWIGEIPEHWKLKRIKDVLKENITDGPHETPVFTDEGIPFLSVDSIQSGELTFENCRYISKEDHEEYKLKCAPIKEDILMGKAASTGKIARVKVDFEFSVWSPLALIRPDIKKIGSVFLEYLLKSDSIQHNIQILCTVNTQSNIAMQDIPQINVSLPSLTEQQQIAGFLDDKTKKLDKAVNNKLKQIELLKEYQRIIINNAISLGLDRESKSEKSIHPWIDKRNSKWKERKLQYMTYIKGRIGWQSLTTEEYLDSGDYYLITGTDFEREEIDWSTCHFVEKSRYDEDPNIHLMEEDVLITKDGSIGKIVQIKSLPKPATLNSGIMVTRPIKNDYLQRFFFWVLKSHAFGQFIEFNKTGSTIAHLYQRVFNNFYFPVPSLQEQQKIAEFLDEKTSKIQKSIELIEKEVERLEEYKKILINEAVTGKIKVF